MEKPVFIIYLILLVISPLLFGAVHTYAYTIVSLGVLTGSLLLLKKNIRIDYLSGTYRFYVIKTSLNFLFFALLAFLFFQIIPLPGLVLKYLSPEAFVVGQKSLSALNLNEPAFHPGSGFSLSPYTYPVRMSIVRWSVYGFFFLGLAQVLNSRKRIELTIFLILITGCFDALYGLIQTYSGSNHIWWFKRLAASYKVVAGTYINRNHFAGFMEMGLLLAAAYAAALLFRTRKKRVGYDLKAGLKKRLLWYFSGEKNLSKGILVLFVGAVLGLGLVLSASRGGIISIAAALLCMSLIFFFKKNHRRKGFVILIVCLVTSVYAINIGVERTIKRFEYADATYEKRTRRAKKTLEIFKDYKLAGIGVGNYQYVYPLYQPVEEKKSFLRHAHNDWVQFLAESGLTGFCLLIGGMLYYLYQTINQWKKRKDPFAVSLGMAPLVVLTAMAIHSYTDFNLHIPANCLILAAILAVGYSALHLKRHGHRETMLYRYYKLPLRYKGGVALVFFLALICWSGSWTIRHFMAEAYCNTVTNSTLNRDQEPPVAEIEKAIAWDRYNAQYRFKLAQEKMKIRDVERLNPDGTAEEKRAHQKKIIDALEEAVRLNPFNAEYHVRLGWEYTHRWQEPDYHQKWLPAADISMERGTYFAGEKNSHLHLELGNYWVMRSKTMNPAEQGWEPAWTRACWHYHKVLELETGRKRKQAVQEIRQHVWIFYPDEEFVLQAIEQG